MPLELPTVTGYSSFWGGSNVYAPLSIRSNVARRGMQLVARDRPLRAALDALINAGATPSFSETYKRVQAEQDVGQALSGSRTIETVTLVSDTIAAGNVTDLDDLVDYNNEAPLTYPADLSGNGGGGKNGF